MNTRHTPHIHRERERERERYFPYPSIREMTKIKGKAHLLHVLLSRWGVSVHVHT